VLTKPGIPRVMDGQGVDGPTAHVTTPGQVSNANRANAPDIPPDCRWSSEPEDARLPGAVGVVGVLVAVTCIGLFPAAGPLPSLIVSCLGGLAALWVAAPTLPPLNLVLFPSTSLMRGASVVLSARR
jgi:hypothetical protein